MFKSETYSEAELNRKVYSVWLVQKDKRFLLNYFFDFFAACAYQESFRMFKIEGQIIFEECTFKYFLEENVIKGGIENA